MRPFVCYGIEITIKNRCETDRQIIIQMPSVDNYLFYMACGWNLIWMHTNTIFINRAHPCWLGMLIISPLAKLFNRWNQKRGQKHFDLDKKEVRFWTHRQPSGACEKQWLLSLRHGVKRAILGDNAANPTSKVSPKEE